MSIGHYENFPVASLLCPKHLRAPIQAIYHFARTADDIADEGDATVTARLADLDLYKQDLRQCMQDGFFSQLWPHIFTPLAHAIRTHQLPVIELQKLLIAFENDVERTAQGYRYQDTSDLHAYCENSANPIGRLLLHLYDIQDAQSILKSNSVCTALQLVNFWRDLSEDIPRKRYYLPELWCQEYDITDASMCAQHDTAQMRAMLQALCIEAKTFLKSGFDLPLSIGGRVGFELRLVILGARHILEKIEKNGYNAIVQRPYLSGLDWCIILGKAIFRYKW